MQNGIAIIVLSHLRWDFVYQRPQHLLSRLPAARRSAVSFLPLVTPDELPARLAEFDLGLALEPHWLSTADGADCVCVIHAARLKTWR